ncbi:MULTISPECIES: gluconokinase [Corynebacterium]|uniref:gluconokinase n=1 Tax=Corynebacterium TaxID=1716 RepID=UPI00124C99A8|nr:MULTISPECIES: gluconokinase [Corynebacterium]
MTTQASGATSTPTVRHIVCMGVSGTGKSVVGEYLAAELGAVFADADSFHPQANKAKMAAGIPLTDEDRWPWLENLRQWIADQDKDGVTTVLACSALKRSYRDILAAGAEGVFFLHLVASKAITAERMNARAGHFMPASLLDSQLATLEDLAEDEFGEEVSNNGSLEQTQASALRSIAEHSPEATH